MPHKVDILAQLEVPAIDNFSQTNFITVKRVAEKVSFTVNDWLVESVYGDKPIEDLQMPGRTVVLFRNKICPSTLRTRTY